MSDEDLQTPDMSVGDVHSEGFDPLLFLADVAIQDAMQDVSLQDIVMLDAETEDVGVQDTASQATDTNDADTQPAGIDYTGSQDVKTQDATTSHNIKHEANPDNAESSTRQAVKDQFILMLASQPLETTDPSSSTLIDSAKGGIENEEPDNDALGNDKAGRKRTTAERVAAGVERMTKQEAEEEQQILKEMKQDEEMNGPTAIGETGGALLKEIEATGILPEDAILVASLADQDPEDITRDDIVVVGSKRRVLQQATDVEAEIVRKKFSLFTELSNYLELSMELAKHLSINDLISLYAISKDFHETLNGHLTHILKACAGHQAPESSRIFVFTLYRSLCISDPVGRPDPINPLVPRMVPSLKWLSMVIHREKCVRDILACMAREGHRMPKTMPLSMKKMWLMMDIPTSSRRVQLMHNEIYWTDNDLYNIQMFIIKLDMRLNDPIEGPSDDGLRKLMLGQRGLTPLCHLLKRTRFTRGLEALEACVRYSYWPRPEHRHLPILGVPANQVGRGHLEGWGVGNVHLYRPDELVMRESCRRNMDLKSHIYTMMVWGYVDATTGENIKVTKEEIYMSDEEVMKKKKKKRNGQPSGKERKTRRDRDNEKAAEDSSEKKKNFEHLRVQDEKNKDREGDMSMAG